MTEAEKHLGNVLSLLCDLDLGEICQSHADAIKFYNTNNPDQKVMPLGLGPSYLIHLIGNERIDLVLTLPNGEEIRTRTIRHNPNEVWENPYI